MGHSGDPVDEEEVIEIEEPDRGDRCPAKIMKAPRVPTLAEREAHMATHLPHEDWCEICMKGRGRNAPHRRRKRRTPVDGESSGEAGSGSGPASSEDEPKEADSREGLVPKVSMD